MGYCDGLRSVVCIALVTVARLARADELDHLPGTFDDPVRMLEVFPGVELVPVAGVPTGIAIRDAAPDQNRVLFDGFEIPSLLAGGRSVMFRDQSQVSVASQGFGVESGRATGGIIEVFTVPSEMRGFGYEVTPLDASLSVFDRGLSLGVRGSFYEPTGVPLTLDGSTHDGSFQFRKDWKLSAAWSLSASAIGATSSAGSFGREVLDARYKSGAWHAVIAGSVLASNASSFDTRAQLLRDLGPLAGLHALSVSVGQDTQITGSHANEAAWATTTASLTRKILFIGGVRADAFDSHVTVQPRGTLALLVDGVLVELGAGAYRRPSDDATPERATQLALSAEAHAGGASVEASAYYVDRERLLVDDGKATGVGTSVGIELRAVLATGPWRAALAASLSHATRADTPMAPSHAADYDLPAHVDAMASWRHGAWRLGARVQLRSGLPYTPVTGALYDADTDSYSPFFGKVMSARLPWRRELDLRVDRQLLPRLRAYVDVALDGGVLGYAYSYDYGRRLDVRALPVLPWVGIAGTL